VITTAGYRVGPSEIEHTLMKHPAVAMSAVVGLIRSAPIDQAWIVLRPGFAPGELAREIRNSSRCSSPPTNIHGSCSSRIRCR
jgi:acetyl-CoA synthetase